MKNKLGLSRQQIDRARRLAKQIVAPVQKYIFAHTTVTVERATLRCLGADGADADGTPVPNLAVESLGGEFARGAARYYVNALLRKGLTVDELNAAIADGLDISSPELGDFEHIRRKANDLVGAFAEKVAANVAKRDAFLREHPDGETPMLYLIVATGNIHEDVKQAAATVQQGADVIAVIRSTAQSLMDYVPYGATTEGFGGTYATQANFRIMRKALDEAAWPLGRYVRLVNYCSGLCMPEIAVMGAVERLDMMLNDSMYGILFRDINMYRTFVDQHFSRMVNALADVVINTGEDNYLTTSDAFAKAHTVLASQFINERFAYNTGLTARLMGLGHAFEMDPKMRNGMLYELAQAQMAREIFPKHPLKYMPPTKFMTGDVFMGYAMNAMFNFVSKATGQSIHLLGMLTEALHTPHIQDRYLAIQSARYIMNNMADFQEEVLFKPDGIIVERARGVLTVAIEFLSEVERIGLFNAIEQGMFADVKRPRNGGKGLEGVAEKADDYWNPVADMLYGKLRTAVKP
jgi:beta-lysine 5,6-aminomutase alpha subunit